MDDITPKNNPLHTSSTSACDPLPSKPLLSLSLKVFGILSILAGGVAIALLAYLVVDLVLSNNQQNADAAVSSITLAIFIAQTILMTIQAIAVIVLGVRLLLNKRHHAASATNIMIVVQVGIMLCNIMLYGLTVYLIACGLVLLFLIVMNSYLDPSLAEERELQRKLHDMETRQAAEDGTLGRDETGKGYIALNFFNLFWIFAVCCTLGLVIESVYHVVIVDPGHYENRTGLLFGPFSPIYGFGALLMTLALNRFHDKNPVFIFLISALIGGAFEYLVSWFMQFAFGIVAWDYTGTFLSIGGRTNFFFMCMWGLLGVFWIKLCLPRMLKLVNLIPWDWRYALTAVCSTLMILDGAMTLLALDCWYQRIAGTSIEDSAVVSFFDRNFNNDYMEQHFQSMSIDPDNATRTQ